MKLLVIFVEKIIWLLNCSISRASIIGFLNSFLFFFLFPGDISDFFFFLCYVLTDVKMVIKRLSNVKSQHRFSSSQLC